MEDQHITQLEVEVGSLESRHARILREMREISSAMSSGFNYPVAGPNFYQLKYDKSS